MKKAIYALMLILAVATGCRRVDHDGALDGFWKIQSIHYLANDSLVTPDKPRMIAIQLEIMQLRMPDRLTSGEISYDKKNNILGVDFRSGSLSPDILKQFGVLQNPVTFHTHATRRHLTLENDSVVIQCLRF